MTLVEQQQLLVHDVRHLEDILLGERVTGRQRGEKRFVEQRLDTQAVVGHWQGQQTSIQPAVNQMLQNLRRHLLTQQEAQTRMLPVDQGQRVRQVIRSQGGNDTQMKRARHRILRVLGEFADTFGFFDDIARSRKDFPADGSRRDALQTAVEQRHAQEVL